jgi:hypothetical protein
MKEPREGLFCLGCEKCRPCSHKFSGAHKCSGTRLANLTDSVHLVATSRFASKIAGCVLRSNVKLLLTQRGPGSVFRFLVRATNVNDPNASAFGSDACALTRNRPDGHKFAGAHKCSGTQLAVLALRIAKTSLRCSIPGRNMH